nr:MAG TPA: hypothetical protein [Caudoviricetes sp.]
MPAPIPHQRPGPMHELWFPVVRDIPARRSAVVADVICVGVGYDASPSFCCFRHSSKAFTFSGSRKNSMMSLINCSITLLLLAAFPDATSKRLRKLPQFRFFYTLRRCIIPRYARQKFFKFLRCSVNDNFHSVFLLGNYDNTKITMFTNVMATAMVIVLVALVSICRHRVMAAFNLSISTASFQQPLVQIIEL